MIFTHQLEEFPKDGFGMPWKAVFNFPHFARNVEDLTPKLFWSCKDLPTKHVEPFWWKPKLEATKSGREVAFVLFTDIRGQLSTRSLL